MTETDRPRPDAPDVDDVEGHRRKFRADSERDESDDVDGHKVRWNADAEGDESDLPGTRRP